MTKKKIDSHKSIWSEPDHHFSPEEYRFVELWSYGDKKLPKTLNDQFQKDLDQLTDDEELQLEIATGGIEEYSYTYIDRGKKNFRVIIRASTKGSLIVGKTNILELKNAINETNGDLSQLSYKNFYHKVDENGIVENDFGELEGGAGDYEIADITSEQKITEKDREYIEASDYYDYRDTLGVAFFDVDELKVFVSVESLKRVGII